jgi:superoxide dismutase, Cu-Zn family
MKNTLLPGALLLLVPALVLWSQERPRTAVAVPPRTAVAVDKAAPAAVVKAIAVITPFQKSAVKGTVTFVQNGDEVTITGELTNLKPGKHGFHIHEFGDISGKDGLTTGGHYNPTKMDHGSPTDKVRHVGDLGNITADEDGKAVVKITDKVIRLTGPMSIMGRAVVIHADPDDFGQPVGHAGARLAGGVIGLAK